MATTHDPGPRIGGSDISAPPTRKLRADAKRNRLRIIAAARELFADRGLDVTLDDVAAAAGVGVGTVYRRFANRDDLILGVFIEHLENVVTQTTQALEQSDPWTGVVDLMTWFGTVAAEDRGLVAIIMEIDHSHPAIEATKERLTERVDSVFYRAQSAGVIRADFAVTDVFAMFTMVAAIAQATEQTVPGAWRRSLEMLLDSIHEGGRVALTTAPLTPEQIQCIQHSRAKEGAGGGVQ